MTALTLSTVRINPLVVLPDGNLLHLGDIFESCTWSELAGEVAMHLEVTVRADIPTAYGELHTLLGNGATLRLDADWGQGAQTLFTGRVWHRWYRDTGVKTVEVHAYDALIAVQKNDCTIVLDTVPTPANQVLQKLLALPQIQGNGVPLGDLSGPTASIYQQVFRAEKGIDIANSVLRWAFMRTPPDDPEKDPYFLQVRNGLVTALQPGSNSQVWVLEEQQSLSSIEEEDSLDDLVTEVALVTLLSVGVDPSLPPAANGFYQALTVVIPDPATDYAALAQQSLGQGFDDANISPSDTGQQGLDLTDTAGNPLLYDFTTGTVQTGAGVVQTEGAQLKTTQDVQDGDGNTVMFAGATVTLTAGTGNAGWLIVQNVVQPPLAALAQLPLAQFLHASLINAFIQKDVASLFQQADVQSVQQAGLHVRKELNLTLDNQLGAQAQALDILQAQDRPWKVGRYRAPLLPNLRKGDALYVRGGTYDGIRIVTGVQHDATSLTSSITCDSSGILGRRVSKQFYIGPFADEQDTVTALVLQSNATNQARRDNPNGSGANPGDFGAQTLPPGSAVTPFNPNTPPVLQSGNWQCSAASTAWMLQSLGIACSQDDVIRQSGGDPSGATCDTGIITRCSGLTHGNGDLLDAWLSGAPLNLPAHHDWLSYADILKLAGKVPLMIGSSNWGGQGGHWSAVSGVDMGASAGPTLLLANPSPGLGTRMTPTQFASIGSFAAVWIGTP